MNETALGILVGIACIQVFSFLIGVLMCWGNCVEGVYFAYDSIKEKATTCPQLPLFFPGYMIGYLVGFMVLGILIFICYSFVLVFHCLTTQKDIPFSCVADRYNDAYCVIKHNKKSFSVEKQYARRMEFLRLFRKVDYIQRTNKEYYHAMQPILDDIYNSLKYTYENNRGEFNLQVAKSEILVSEIYNLVLAMNHKERDESLIDDSKPHLEY